MQEDAHVVQLGSTLHHTAVSFCTLTAEWFAAKVEMCTDKY